MSRNGFWRLATLLSIVFLGAIAWRASAQQGASAPDPPVTATVDLERVINGLEQLQTMQGELQEFVQERRDRLQELGRQLDGLQGELEVLPRGAEQFRDKLEEAARVRATLDMERELSDQRIAIRRGAIFSELYDKVKVAIAELSAQRGYDLVLNDDSNVQIGGQTEADIIRQISSVKFLHTAERLDITDELIAKMNNEWRAGVRQP